MRGFSYIEIVVAVGIVGVCLVASEALVRAVPLERVTHDEDLAVTIANDELGALRAAGYGSLPASGAFSNSSLASLPSGTGALAVTDYNAKTKQVVVTVSWQEPSASSRSVTLSTLITQTGGLP